MKKLDEIRTLIKQARADAMSNTNVRVSIGVLCDVLEKLVEELGAAPLGTAPLSRGEGTTRQ